VLETYIILRTKF